MLYTPTQALRHLRALATTSVPNCVNLAAIDRVLTETNLVTATPAVLSPERLVEIRELIHQWGVYAATKPHATQSHLATTYASELLAEVDLLTAKVQYLVDDTHRWSAAVKKLEAERCNEGVIGSQVAPLGIVALGVPSNPPCSPLNCDGCEKCQQSTCEAVECPAV